jgi:hypothetical protein
MVAIDDLYPTLLALAGVRAPAGLPLDGRDFSAVLRADAPSPRRQYCWIWTDRDAIRTERWKLVRLACTRELYDLGADPGEVRDVSAEHPEVVRSLQADLDAWESSIPCYPSHVPVRLAAPARPEPSGEVLELRSRGIRKPISFTLSTKKVLVGPGDRLEYDMLVADGSPEGGFVVGAGREGGRSSFERIGAVDQYGTLQASGAGFPQARGRWARRVVGLANVGPNQLGPITLEISAPGELLLYLDNIVVRRSGGDEVVLYRGGVPPPAARGAADVAALAAVPVERCRMRLRD